MAKRRSKRTAVSSRAAKPQVNEVGLDKKETQTENENVGFRDPERRIRYSLSSWNQNLLSFQVLIIHFFERHIAATRAICDMEIEHLLTGVQLLRSYMNKERLQTPVLRLFEESLPSVSVEHGRDRQVDMNWENHEGNISLDNVEEDLHVSLLRRVSISCPHFPGAWQAFSEIQLLSRTGNAMLDGTGAPSVGNHAMEDPFRSLVHGLQTTGANSQRLSIGMTPRIQRHLKHVEVLLSVHGSPLGIHKEENNMEAIVGKSAC